MRPPLPRENQTALASNGKFPPLAHQLSTFLLAAASVAVVVKFFVPMDSDWPEALLIVLAAINTLTDLARRLPLQNVLGAAAGIAFIGGALHALDVKSGMPFGPLTFGAMGPLLFKTLPWPVPLIWIVVVLNSRGVARLILRPWRKIKNYGFWLVGLSGVLTMLFDFALDPFMWRVKRYWVWEQTKLAVTWQGVPLVNFLVWGAVTLLILAFVTPVLINKQPGRRSAPGFHPLAVWLGAILIFGTGCARQGLWQPVAADAVIGTVTAVFAVRGARW